LTWLPPVTGGVDEVGGGTVVELPEVEFPEVPTVVVLPDEVWFMLEVELTLEVEFTLEVELRLEVLFEISPMVELTADPTVVPLMVELLRGSVALSPGSVALTPVPTGKVELLPMSGILVPLLVLLLPEIIPVLLLVLFEGRLTVPLEVELPPVGRVELDPEVELLPLGVDEGTDNVDESTMLHS
jgi:hypothetical protein